jgi:gas vesicle protein
MNNNMKVFTGFSLGLLAGAVAALLYAPDSGKKTRKKISKYANDTYEDSMKKVDSFTKELNKEIDKLSSKSKDTINHVKESLALK